ncbi:MAG: ribulose-phosphate 3-epimerase [Candidatus Midichloriaceae bacterium]|jgi:ribulose-phosphate 3-epimerase|nr:ribulose-phosphate 3-epimerase [Candidatus Midichloriaceae bacterium]
MHRVLLVAIKLVKISASILSANFSNFGLETQKLEDGGTDMIHFDIMDGHFVPNLTFGSGLIKDLRPKSKLQFDTHLMVSNPEDYIEACAYAGSDYITVHAESTKHLHRLIAQIKATGKKAGVSIIPSTHEDALKCVIDDVDLILVMTVNPGFGGQKFIESQLTKIQNIRKMIDATKQDILLSVDGGINEKSAPLCVKAGADVLVSGAYIFSGDNYAARIKTLRN